jgi:hypothetical protein
MFLSRIKADYIRFRVIGRKGKKILLLNNKEPN